VQEKIKSIFHLKKPLQPVNLVLGIIPSAIDKERDKYLYTILRIAALKQITQNWL